MTALRAFLVSRWFVTFIGTALLALLVWFFGPFLPVLEDWNIRLAIVVAMLALWAGLNLVFTIRRARREAALAKGVTETPPDSASVASAGVIMCADSIECNTSSSRLWARS